MSPEVHLTMTGGTPFTAPGENPYTINTVYEYWISYEENGIETYVPGAPVITGGAFTFTAQDALGCQILVH